MREPKPRPLPMPLASLSNAAWKEHIGDDLEFINPKETEMDSEGCNQKKKVKVVFSPVVGALRLARRDFVGHGQVVAKIENKDPDCGVHGYDIPAGETAYWVVQGANSASRKSYILLEGVAKKRKYDFTFTICDDGHVYTQSEVRFDKGCGNRAVPRIFDHLPAWITCANGCCYNDDTRAASPATPARN